MDNNFFFVSVFEFEAVKASKRFTNKRSDHPPFDSFRLITDQWMILLRPFLLHSSRSTCHRLLHTSLQQHYVPIQRQAMFQDSKIELTEVEEKICDLFDKCTTYLKEEKNITTSCRFAGGWVRDKVNR